MEPSPLRIETQERISEDYGLYTWPCAPVLGYYVYRQKHKIAGKSILELGSGTAVPGLIAAKCGGHVTLSDREDNPCLLGYLKETCELNGLTNVKIIGLTWGVVSPNLININEYDYILASDCFYDSKDFEDVMATVAYVMKKRSGCVFWTTYQERSSNRTLLPLLERWSLKCNIITIEEEWSDGIQITGPTQHYLNITTNVNKHSIKLMEITNKQ